MFPLADIVRWRPLLRPGIAYDPASALDWAEATFVPLLPR
jgi:hypothetical protein